MNEVISEWEVRVHYGQIPTEAELRSRFNRIHDLVLPFGFEERLDLCKEVPVRGEHAVKLCVTKLHAMQPNPRNAASFNLGLAKADLVRRHLRPAVFEELLAYYQEHKENVTALGTVFRRPPYGKFSGDDRASFAPATWYSTYLRTVPQDTLGVRLLGGRDWDSEDRFLTVRL